MTITSSFIAIILATFNIALADAPPGTTTTYNSPNGVQEACVDLPDIPGGEYSKKDHERAQKHCKVDLYNNEKFALCPKIWSTSAAVMVYKIDEVVPTMDAKAYEATYCRSKDGKPENTSTAYKIKFTMNQKDTSGTFSQAWQVYYHVARYFGTAVDTPVAVYREIDPKVLLERVATQGLDRAPKGKIKAAWDWLVKALKDPAGYNQKEDLFISDLSKVYGSAAKDLGEAYDTEINGARSAGWGVPENKQFQETAAFRALRTPGPLVDATEAGLKAAGSNKELSGDLINITPFQMIFWMRELTEITLLDYIFGQQDRVGNIDFLWKWYWVENGEVKSMDEESEEGRKKMHTISVPAEIAAFNPVLIQRSHLGDSDAGVATRYTNFAKVTKMLENINHYSAKIYTKLIQLDIDLQNKGQVYEYLYTHFNLTDAEMKQIVTNTNEAAAIIKAQCQAGTLAFDLDEPKSFLIDGEKKSVSLDCNNPVFN